MEITELRKYLSENGLMDELVQYIKRIEVKPKTILLSEGEVAKKLYIVEKGCLRSYFYKDGRDITFQFFMENDAVASFQSFFNGCPSQLYIESIEQTKLLVLNKKNIDIFLNKYPDVQKIMSSGILNRLFFYTNHLMSFLKDKPIERYQNLIKNNPQIIQRIPHHYIASYLGITPVSLSRLRNKLAKKKPFDSPAASSRRVEF
jgi:CRP-like cAMP-binding protein